MNYRPVGTSVLLKLLPQTNKKSSLVLPDGKTHPGEIQQFEIVAIGNEVNDDKFKLNAGETVIVGGAHPSEAVWVDVEQRLLLLDRRKVICVVESQIGNN